MFHAHHKPLETNGHLRTAGFNDLEGGRRKTARNENQGEMRKRERRGPGPREDNESRRRRPSRVCQRGSPVRDFADRAMRMRGALFVIMQPFGFGQKKETGHNRRHQDAEIRSSHGWAINAVANALHYDCRHTC